MNKIGTHYRYRISPSGKPDKEVDPKVIKEDFPFTEAYINEMNAQTNQHGNFIVVDEEKTEAYYEAGKKRKEQMKDEQEMKQAIALTKLNEVAEKAIEKVAVKATTKKRQTKTENNGN